MRRYLVPLIIILISAFGYWFISSNAPQPRKRPAPKPAKLAVEISKVAPKGLQITLASLGQVSAAQSSVISSQVSGRVVEISAHLQEGAFFKKGELLLKLDAREFQNEINSAKASLTQAQQDLKLEQAQVAQAKADWKRLNKNAPIPTLVSRTPQVVSAKAKVSAAHASFNQAVLNFERTKVLAPFDGRVLTKNVNIGEFVNANTPLANIFSTRALEVKLSLKNSDLAFIDLPETNTDNQALAPSTKVIFEANLIEPQLWQGELVRTQASLDEQSQQLFVIAQIKRPFSAQNSDKHPLKIGQYLEAKISAKNIPQAISIDIKTIYQGQYVYLLRKGIVRRQDISILWQDDSIALIGNGLKAGDLLITSILTQDDEGSNAQFIGSEKATRQKKGKGAGKGQNRNLKKPNRDKGMRANKEKKPLAANS